MPWATSAVVITVGQVLMWHGWNASGEWIPVTGSSAISAYALSAAFAAAPVVLALFICRYFASLAVVLVLLFGYSALAAEGFSTSTSSTAGIAWIGPAFLGFPLVLIVFVAENIGPVLWRRPTRRS